MVLTGVLSDSPRASQERGPFGSKWHLGCTGAGCGTMVMFWEPVGAWLALALALSASTGAAAPQQDCTGVECPLLENCIEEALEPGSCCATCVQQGCACEGYQYYDCLQGGFVRGRVPAGQSYFVDFGSTECSCPPGGGKISCQFMLCPELPPNCIETVVAADSCPQCGQVGCVHTGRKYTAGHTVHLPPCQACHCPDTGGELICYQVPSCHGDAEAMPTAASGNFSDAEGNEPERHYEDPYSYDQELAEAEAAVALAGELQASTGAPANLGGGSQTLSAIQATPWLAVLLRPTAAAALGPPAPIQAKARKVMEDSQGAGEEEREDIAVREPQAASGLRGLDGPLSAGPAMPSHPVQEEKSDTKAVPEDNLISDAQVTPQSTGHGGASPMLGSSTASVLQSQATSSSSGNPTKPSSYTILTTPPHEATQVLPIQEVSKQPPALPHLQPEEDTDPNSVHSVPRSDPEGKPLS